MRPDAGPARLGACPSPGTRRQGQVACFMRLSRRHGVVPAPPRGSAAAAARRWDRRSGRRCPFRRLSDAPPARATTPPATSAGGGAVARHDDLGVQGVPVGTLTGRRRPGRGSRRAGPPVLHALPADVRRVADDGSGRGRSVAFSRSSPGQTHGAGAGQAELALDHPRHRASVTSAFGFARGPTSCWRVARRRASWSSAGTWESRRWPLCGSGTCAPGGRSSPGRGGRPSTARAGRRRPEQVGEHAGNGPGEQGLVTELSGEVGQEGGKPSRFSTVPFGLPERPQLDYSNPIYISL